MIVPCSVRGNATIYDSHPLHCGMLCTCCTSNKPKEYPPTDTYIIIHVITSLVTHRLHVCWFCYDTKIQQSRINTGNGPIGVVLWFPSYVKYTYLCIGKVPLPWHRTSTLLMSYSIEYACASCLVPRNVELWSGTFYNDYLIW